MRLFVPVVTLRQGLCDEVLDEKRLWDRCFFFFFFFSLRADDRVFFSLWPEAESFFFRFDSASDGERFFLPFFS